MVIEWTWLSMICKERRGFVVPHSLLFSPCIWQFGDVQVSAFEVKTETIATDYGNLIKSNCI